MFKTPEQYWKGTEIGKKSTSKIIRRTPYLLPKGKETVFKKLVEWVLQQEKYQTLLGMKGYLDLDLLYKNSKDAPIKKLREKTGIEKPFCNRRLYQLRSPVIPKVDYAKKEEKDEDGNFIDFIDMRPLVQKDNTKEKKPVIDDSGNLIITKYYGSFELSIFHNKELGWTEDWEKPEQNVEINAEGKYELSEGEEGEEGEEKEIKYRYQYVRAWIPKTVGDALSEIVLTGLEEAKKQNVQINAIYFFGFIENINKKKFNNKDQYEINLDDFIMMME